MQIDSILSSTFLFINLYHFDMKWFLFHLFLSYFDYFAGAAYRLEKDLLTITKHEWVADVEEKKLLGGCKKKFSI